MSTQAMPSSLTAAAGKRIESIDLLRGVVIIIMALDHVRDFFHGSAYLYDPTDLSRTSVPIFFTRWITHFCAPVFILLAGVSAYLYGAKRNRRELAYFLFTRGLILLLAEFFIITLGWTFNPAYPVYILQVIWAIGIAMMTLALLVFLDKRWVLLIGILCIAAHNLMDNIHAPNNNFPSFLWSAVHEPRFFSFGPIAMFVGYPVLPWIGVIAIGYSLGSTYANGYDQSKRKMILLTTGLGMTALFIVVRLIDTYGDQAHWSAQKNTVFTFLSFLNTTKYPPSFLYLLMTLGPALIFLAYAEKPLNSLSRPLVIFGRVPMFFYVIHIYFIHLLAMLAATMTGHKWSDMVLTGWVTANPQLQGYGFSLLIVYLVWIGVILVLYPLCKWFDKYKRAHVGQQKWLSYF